MKKPFRFIRKRKTSTGVECEYEASFWEGPLNAGESGRYVRTRISDFYANGRFANTSPGVSYYSELLRAVK